MESGPFRTLKEVNKNSKGKTKNTSLTKVNIVDILLVIHLKIMNVKEMAKTDSNRVVRIHSLGAIKATTSK